MWQLMNSKIICELGEVIVCMHGVAQHQLVQIPWTAKQVYTHTKQSFLFCAMINSCILLWADKLDQSHDDIEQAMKNKGMYNVYVTGSTKTQYSWKTQHSCAISVLCNGCEGIADARSLRGKGIYISKIMTQSWYKWYISLYTVTW